MAQYNESHQMKAISLAIVDEEGHVVFYKYIKDPEDQLFDAMDDTMRY